MEQNHPGAYPPVKKKSRKLITILAVLLTLILLLGLVFAVGLMYLYGIFGNGDSIELDYRGMTFRVPENAQSAPFLNDTIYVGWDEKLMYFRESRDDSNRSAKSHARRYLKDLRSEGQVCNMPSFQLGPCVVFEMRDGDRHAWGAMVKEGDALFSFTYECEDTLMEELFFRRMMLSVRTEDYVRPGEEVMPAEETVEDGVPCTLREVTVLLPKESQEVGRTEKAVVLEWDNLRFGMEYRISSPLGGALEDLEFLRDGSVVGSLSCSEIKVMPAGYYYFSYTYFGDDGNIRIRHRCLVDGPGGSVWEFTLMSDEDDPKEDLFCMIMNSMTFE